MITFNNLATWMLSSVRACPMASIMTCVFNTISYTQFWDTVMPSNSTLKGVKLYKGFIPLLVKNFMMIHCKTNVCLNQPWQYWQKPSTPANKAGSPNPHKPNINPTLHHLAWNCLLSRMAKLLFIMIYLIQGVIP